MARSTASTVGEYLAGLPEDRRAVVLAVRNHVLRHLPAGYEETMNWGAISYEVPLERYPRTYNGQPLSFAALAAQKNYYALYLMCVYEGSEHGRILRDAYAAMGKQPDVGKSCIRFRSPDDLPLDAIGGIIASLPPEAYIRWHEAARQRR
jgi:hypothetical protein